MSTEEQEPSGLKRISVRIGRILKNIDDLRRKGGNNKKAIEVQNKLLRKYRRWRDVMEVVEFDAWEEEQKGQKEQGA